LPTTFLIFAGKTGQYSLDDIHDFPAAGNNGDEKGADFIEYIAAMKKIIGEYGIGYIDLYENGIPKPTTDLGDEYTIDGLHPNDNGYKLIAEKVCDYIKHAKIKD
jgi:lysophospholipase L1-like esterase